MTFSFYNETLFNGYKANEPGDHSGDYYPAAKVRALVAKLEYDWDSDWPMPPCVLEFLHELAALEAEDD